MVPVVVDGRAGVADDRARRSHRAAALDVETYAALGMGRLDPGAALAEGRVTIVGDEELGRAVVGAMYFMI